MSKLKTSTNVADAAKNADLIIEAIVENVDAKRSLFAALEAAAPP